MASSSQGLSSGFFPSKNHDRLYTADQLANVISALISDGIIESSGDANAVPFVVTFNASDATSVNIGRGMAWLNNTWTVNSSIASISMTDAIAIGQNGTRRESGGSPANASYPRWDAIAIEVNKTSTIRANTFVVVEGAPASNPQRPTVTNFDNPDNGVFYHPLAFVYRPARANSSDQYKLDSGTTNISIVIGQTNGTPFVRSIAGAAVTIDDIVKAYTDAVNSKIAELNTKIAGVASKEISDGSVFDKNVAAGANISGSKLANSSIPSSKLNFSVISPENGKVPADAASSLLVRLTSNTTLGSSHAGSTMYSDSANSLTFTIPSTVVWPAGTEMEFIRYGTGELKLSGSGNTYFCSVGNARTQTAAIADQYGTIVMKLISNNTWLLVGDLA